MDLNLVASSVLILVGAAVMVFSILKSRELPAYIPFIPEAARPSVRRSLGVHRTLMLFFLAGYLFVAGAFIAGRLNLDCLVIGSIFFFGSVFVLIGVRLQARMLMEIQNTLSGLLPICASCKKVREGDADPRDDSSWTQIECYLSHRTHAEFSHGLCPECYRKMRPARKPELRRA